MKNDTIKKIIRIISLSGLVICVLFVIYGLKTGIFTSQEKLQNFIGSFGIAGALAFVLFQAVQVVVPIAPCGISCFAGVILFGPLKGFLYNYLGVCIGSVLAFLVSRNYGKPVLQALFSQEKFDKYENWTSEKKRFTKLFAIAIFLPFAPDNFLCYMAGTTSMSLSKFTAIILLGKPFGMLLYSTGFIAAFNRIVAVITG